MNYKLKFESATPLELPYLSDYNITFWIPVHEKYKKNVLIGTTAKRIILLEMSEENDKAAVIVSQSEVEDIAIKAKVSTT